MEKPKIVRPSNPVCAKCKEPDCLHCKEYSRRTDFLPAEELINPTWEAINGFIPVPPPDKTI